MKKGIAFVLAVVLALFLCACGEKTPPEHEDPAGSQTEEPAAGMPNPVTELSSLEELNEQAGTNLVSPPVMGVSGEEFRLIDGENKIAEYRFTVGGIPYQLRAARGAEEDISGVYLENGKAFGERTDEEIAYASTETEKLARWFAGDEQLVLHASEAAELDGATFAAIAEELYGLTAVSEE